MRKKVVLWSLGIIVIVSSAIITPILIIQYYNKKNTSTNTPIYVTIAGHVENGDYYSNENVYPNYRKKLLDFADLIRSYNLPFNLQIDYNFFLGALTCETTKMQEITNNTNIIDYLARWYNFEIDPHKDGGWEEETQLYADVRYIGGQITSEISENVGGIVWNQEEQFTRLANGEQGELYPDFTWYPEILTLGVHSAHHLGYFSNDDSTSGIWKPKGFGDDFHIHDESASMIYVGPGYTKSSWSEEPDVNQTIESAIDYIEVLAENLEKGEIKSNKMYTVSFPIPQKIIFNQSLHYLMTERLDRLVDLMNEGKVICETYSRIVEIWQEDYNSEPNIFTVDELNIFKENKN
jgi:hypothetical protein